MEKTENNPETYTSHTIASSWDRVKIELLNRYYVLMENFKQYHYHVLSKKDHPSFRIELTTLIIDLWYQMRPYNKSYNKIKNYDIWDNSMKALVEKKGILKYEGIKKSIEILSLMGKEGGLTDIEFERQDPGKAINEGQY